MTSPIIFTFPYVFTLTAERLANVIAHHRNIEIQQTSRGGSYLDLEQFIFVKKILILSCDQVQYHPQ